MHRRRAILGAAALALPALPLLPGPAQAQQGSGGGLGTVDLSSYPIGPLPPDFFTAWRTGRGAPGNWRVVEDRSAGHGRAIAQLSADPTDHRFPLAVYGPLPAQDLEASVRFRPISGRVDRAGGLAVRLTDPDNYYVVRANALEDNVRLYRVVKGRREQIAGVSVRVATGEWHTLTVHVQGERFSISLDGEPLLSETDHTFTGLGKVALWTKADSVTHFDRLRIRPL